MVRPSKLCLSEMIRLEHGGGGEFGSALLETPARSPARRMGLNGD